MISQKSIVFKLGLMLVAIISRFSSFAQCPTADFSISGAICPNATLNIVNNSANAVGYTWDFCDGGLNSTPNTLPVHTISEASHPWDIKGVKEGSDFIFFIISNGNNSLLKFKTNDLTSVPLITNLGNLGVMSGIQGIGLWEESGNKYGLVSTGQSNILYRLDFGTSFNNTPTATTINLAGLTDTRSIQIIKNNNKVYALVVGVDRLFICNFGSSITNAPSLGVVLISGAQYLQGVDVVIDCTNAYVIVTGYLSGTHLLTFSSGLDNPPTFDLISRSLVDLPVGISFKKVKNSFIAFVHSYNSDKLTKINFGSSFLSSGAAISTVTTLGALTYGFSFCLIADGTKFYGASIGYVDNQLSILDFPKPCSTNNDFKDIAVPNASFQETGNFSITMTAYGTNGEVSSLTKDISVAQYASSLGFTQQNVCANNSVTLTPTNLPGDVANFNWNFGDGNTSLQQTPAHIYNAANNYNVSLQITGSGGCNATVSKSISIYNPPIASFTFPSSPAYCTNQQLNFLNTSTTDPLSNPQYDWEINGVTTAVTKNYSYQFTSTNPVELKLKVSLQGCSSETTNQFNNVYNGPTIDFSFNNDCAEKPINFNNLTSGSVVGYNWDFGQGENSSLINPQTKYESFGNFNITLTGLTAEGCSSSRTKTIRIYSKPQANFSLSLPPFSCSGSSSQFNDVTPNPVDSNISLWSWDFGDITSGQNFSSDQNPQHTYINSGNYNVSLTATTDYGCSSTIQKQINIAQSPTADFTNTPACTNQPVSFMDASGSGAKSWSWQIENTSYFIKNPIHIFTQPGNYSVDLIVTGNNNCLALTNKTLIVPGILTPDFTFQKNCAGEDTEFDDITNNLNDPVVSQNWDFGSVGTGSGSPSTFTFSTVGNFAVTMKVTAQSGCTYSVTKNVNIISAPTSTFTAVPDVGIPPLAVKFKNTSTNATTFAWAFHDAKNSTSQISSPSFSFQDPGEYIVDLTATNSIGCSNTVSKIIKAILPVYDINVTALTVTKNTDGSLKIMAGLENDGNVTLENFPIVLDLSGFTSIREIVAGPLAANATYNYIFSNEISNSSRLNFLCAQVEVENDNVPENNRKCSSLGEQAFVYDPYPNPANDELNVDWVANDGGKFLVTLTDSMGKQIFSTNVESIEGLNSFKLQTETLKNGIYILKVTSTALKMVKKITIAH